MYPSFHKSKKGDVFETQCSTADMSQTRDQQCFTISEVRTDCRQLEVLQHIMRPSRILSATRLADITQTRLFACVTLTLTR